MKSVSLLWFRTDLRLADNPALQAAIRRAGPIVPLFIWAPEEEGDWPPGAASRWWLHHSLRSLDESLRTLGSRLILRRGPTLETLQKLIRETGASALFWNRRYEPAVIARDQQVEESLRQHGLEVESFNAALLHEPWTIQNQEQKPFRVFTPFWNRCLSQADPEPPVLRPKTLAAPPKWPSSLALESLALEPRIDWAGGLRETWRPGEPGALARLKRFLNSAARNYPNARDRPDLPGTSRLSPHLHFGEIGPRQIWRALSRSGTRASRTGDAWRHSRFAAELGWREFAHHLLFHFPHTPAEPLRSEFNRFEWRRNRGWLKAWQRGRTGYPLVDAGMRELWATGWMHNRVRMVAASFLVKDLLLPWQEGARWFWDTLVDADLAQNTLGWQWTAGCGADAAPFFRIFNPENQAEKFDPKGDYIRRWCPELARLPAVCIHAPHRARPELLARAGVQPGRDYPEPLVNHAIAREVALETYSRMASLKGGS